MHRLDRLLRFLFLLNCGQCFCKALGKYDVLCGPVDLWEMECHIKNYMLRKYY